MKSINILFFLGLAVFAFPIIISSQGLAASNSLDDPFLELTSQFPDAIQLKINGKKSVEFCPDNTCDLVVAIKSVSIDTLKDFTYLYIYFFSDYYVLDDWRKSKRPMLIAENILSKKKYQACRNSNQKEAASCLLRRLSRKNHIELFFVRYDENIRSVVQIDVNSATEQNK